MPELSNIQHPVILFDGVCNLCSNTVQFVIKRDKKKLFKFASLQSSFGQALLKKYQLPTTDFNSFILFQNSKVYFKSTGALMVARQLSGGWPLLYVLIVIPSFIRNIVYNLIANNRYRVFGKRSTCWLPSPELKIRFFD